MTIYSLGDAAVVMDLGNSIDQSLNQQVNAMKVWVRDHPFDGLRDAVSAYSSLTLHYDPLVVQQHYQPKQTISSWVQSYLTKVYDESLTMETDKEETVVIPVCYEEEFSPDLATVAETTGLTTEDVIEIHLAGLYHIYMIGFLPGFPYMGKLDPRIAVPRKSSPRMVTAGSVAITGLQTGIYPIGSPGGWQIIGSTPVRLFDPGAEIPALLRPGQKVKFSRIEKNDYVNFDH
ncbi:MAG: 5-oxoprolinase subunit PxpB [Gemmatimonadaceae bacterium]|nr:5-oxoprolinase subunit PxpB [Chitinophagaceae bacterium]